MSLSREEILAVVERRAGEAVALDVPEWGGEVRIRRLTAAEAERTGLTNDEQPPDVVARVIAASLVDDEGEPLFNEGDVAALADADLSAATRVFVACVKANGLGSEALDEAVAAFSAAQRDSSSSS